MNRFTPIAVTLASSLILVGCSSGTTTPTAATETTATETTSTETTAPSGGTLKVGMECNYAPFNWTTTTAGDSTQPISSVDYCDGYDVVMAATLADAIGMDVEIVKTDWDNLIPALTNGEIDCIIAGMTETPERAEVVSFTSPYYMSQEVAIVRGDSELTTITDIQQLSGYKVMGQLNTLYDDIIDQIEGVNHMTPKEDYPSMVFSLQQGECDALTAELPVAEGVIAANPDLAIVKFDEGKGFVADASVSIAVAKDNADLLAQLQTALDAIPEQTRQDLMLEAVNRQPAVSE